MYKELLGLKYQQLKNPDLEPNFQMFFSFLNSNMGILVDLWKHKAVETLQPFHILEHLPPGNLWFAPLLPPISVEMCVSLRSSLIP